MSEYCTQVRPHKREHIMLLRHATPCSYSHRGDDIHYVGTGISRRAATVHQNRMYGHQHRGQVRNRLSTTGCSMHVCSKATHLASALCSVLAQLCPVAAGMQPHLEDTMSIWAGIATLAGTLAVVWAGNSGVLVQTRVSSHGFLSCKEHRKHREKGLVLKQ